MERIDSEQVRHVARLAEIEFSEGEIEKITPQLDRILDHVARVSSVDTEGIPATSHAVEIRNVLRKDQARDSVSATEALKNAPERMNGGFKVPKID